jgi:hypothetical protein
MTPRLTFMDLSVDVKTLIVQHVSNITNHKHKATMNTNLSS